MRFGWRAAPVMRAEAADCKKKRECQLRETFVPQGGAKKGNGALLDDVARDGIPRMESWRRDGVNRTKIML